MLFAFNYDTVVERTVGLFMTLIRMASIAAVLMPGIFSLRAQDKAQPQLPVPQFDARGITVGVPKAFDNRSLTLMLDTLNESLSRLQFIDQTAISKAVGAIQGSRLQESSQALTIQGLPIPGITTEQSTQQTLAPNAAGALIPSAGTNSSKVTTTQNPLSPVAPSVDVPNAPSALSSQQYGMSSSDLLTEQVDLTYQILNVRMLLDRSLSDRILWTTSGGSTRLQAVIGLNITIDPPRDAENSVAVVEVTLYQDSADPTKRPSLVAVMPQEHTYNSTALSSKASAFGGSAVVKLVNIGYTERKRGQTYYLFRDNDTVSFERQVDPKSGAVTFGWAFRPVLGRKSVSPGPRQMFAVVSLPSEDVATTGPLLLQANVKAYWRKYDQGTLTSANDAEIRPLAKLLHAISLGTRLTYPPAGITDVHEYDIEVPYTSSYLSVLQPSVTKIRWRAAGDKQVVISVEGSNFYQGTKVALGDKVFDTSNAALRLQPDQAFDLTTDFTALRSDGMVLGRYGASVPLEQKTPVKDSQLIIKGLEWDSALGGVSVLQIFPGIRAGLKEDPLPISYLSDDYLGEPIVSINGIVIPGPYEVVADKDLVNHFTVAVPQTAIKDIAGVVQLKFPFKGKQFEAARRAYDPRTKFSTKLLAPKLFLVELLDGPWDDADEGGKKAKEWTIQVGGESIQLNDRCADEGPVNEFCTVTEHDRYARLRLEKESPENAIILFTRPGKSSSYPIVLPKDKPEAPKPEITASQVASIDQNDSVWLTFTGKSLSAISSVTAGPTQLDTRLGDKDDTIMVLLERSISFKSGAVDLSFRDKSGKVIGTARVTVKPTSDTKGQAK